MAEACHTYSRWLGLTPPPPPSLFSHLSSPSYLSETKGYSVLHCRRTFTGCGFLGSASAYVALLLLPARLAGPAATTACLCVANGFAGLHPAGFKVRVSHTGGEREQATDHGTGHRSSHNTGAWPPNCPAG
jgi:hypothetical protein